MTMKVLPPPPVTGPPVFRPNPALAVRSNVSGWIYYTSNNVRFQDFKKS